MSSHPYNVALGDIKPGKPFMMVNYPGIYIRVEADAKYEIRKFNVFDTLTLFNDDGIHVPIVELATGHLFYMSKIKPCFVYPGSDVT